jgi:NitT/TauT family transport system ATP-binding protein
MTPEARSGALLHGDARVAAIDDEQRTVPMSLKLDHVSVIYGQQVGKSNVAAVHDATLELEENQFVSLMGPSGCGKSTLLHAAGGLLRPTSGTVSLSGRPLTAPRPEEVAFVFQDYSLLPWKSVVDNAAIGLRFAGLSKNLRRERAMRQLALMGLGDVADSHPAQLSGGMQQRVAVARALTMEPDVLLLDEPFGALDEITRRTLGVDVSTVLSEARKSLLLVTHSLDEAIYWGDKILVMAAKPGRIIAEITIEAERPRPWNFVATPECEAIRLHLLELLAPGEGN